MSTTTWHRAVEDRLFTIKTAENRLVHLLSLLTLTSLSSADIRRTSATIVAGVKELQAALDNPQEFASQATRVMREKAIQQLVDGIRYEKDGTWYDISEWVETEETVSDRLVPVENSIYDQIVVQSDSERKFAEKLKKRKDVRFFLKLPNWFKVATPVGQYNPDWAQVMESAEDAEALLCLLRETKSTTAADELRGTKNQKIQYGERHFVGGLEVDFKVSHFGRRFTLILARSSSDLSKGHRFWVHKLRGMVCSIVCVGRERQRADGPVTHWVVLAPVGLKSSIIAST